MEKHGVTGSPKVIQLFAGLAAAAAVLLAVSLTVVFTYAPTSNPAVAESSLPREQILAWLSDHSYGIEAEDIAYALQIVPSGLPDEDARNAVHLYILDNPDALEICDITDLYWLNL